jgi:hypothetical protein
MIPLGEKKYEELVQFKQQKGHVIVPQSLKGL